MQFISIEPWKMVAFMLSTPKIEKIYSSVYVRNEPICLSLKISNKLLRCNLVNVHKLLGSVMNQVFVS